MQIRSATTADVKEIHALIRDSAELDLMLFRSMAAIYETLQTFLVAHDGETILGCCALSVVWADLAEIKSLAVRKSARGLGVGMALVDESLALARGMGIQKVFALTLEAGFFAKANFHEITKESLPMKVWSDCAFCPKQHACDEIAVLRTLSSSESA
jgi:amino-acid N-acetyltransferase